MASLPGLKNLPGQVKLIRDSMRDRAGITQFSADSAARSLIDPLAQALVEDRQDSRRALLDLQLSHAEDEALDAIGEAVGVPRLSPTPAIVWSYERSLVFYVNSGTFGDLNGGADIVVPADTIVGTVPDEQGRSRVQYRLFSPLTLPADASTAYATAQAVTLGASHNVDRGALTYMEFADYASGTGLKINNLYPIITGRNRESASQYRYRISQRFNSLQTQNTIHLQMRGIEVPGVVEIRVIPGHYGIGTCGVVVLGPDGVSTQDLVRSVQSRIHVLSIPGLRVVATPGIQVLFDLSLAVKVRAALPEQDQERLRQGIRQSVHSYFREEGLGGSIDLERVRERILEQNRMILQVSPRKERGLLFEAAYVRKGPADSLVTGERETLSGTLYGLEQNEFARMGELTLSFEVSE